MNAQTAETRLMVHVTLQRTVHLHYGMLSDMIYLRHTVADQRGGGLDAGLSRCPSAATCTELLFEGLPEGAWHVETPRAIASGTGVVEE
jgi:hypothetical protein